MKVQYEEIQLNLVMFTLQDVLTTSPFDGDMDGFDTPVPPQNGNNVSFG